jgi:hypothetical protein
LCESRKIISPDLASRYHHNPVLWVAKESPHNIGTGDPAFSHSSKPFNNTPFRAVLKIPSYVVLYRSRLWQLEVLPYQK